MICAADDCDQQFEPVPSTRKNYQPQRFCSTRCRQRQWWREGISGAKYAESLLRGRRRKGLARRSARAERSWEAQGEVIAG